MSFGTGPVPGGSQPLTRETAFLRLVSSPGPVFPIKALRTLVGRTVSMSTVDLDLSSLDSQQPPRISRLHAELTWIDGTLHLRDLGSSNGTWLNDHQLQGRGGGQPSPPQPLKAGDRIRLAHLEFELSTDAGGS